MTWVKNDTWLNGKSFITIDELFDEQLNVLNKLSKVLFDDAYFEDTKIFCRSVLDFAIDHEFITWKQAYAILKILPTEERRAKYHSAYGSYKRIYVYSKQNITDFEHDSFCRQIFGECVHAEELDGYEVNYREDGSRYFSLPTLKLIKK